jgi:hypothetical protein
MAALLGVAAATLSTCILGLFLGTDTWCSPLGFLFGAPFGLVAALVGGLPLWFVFRRLNFTKHWQFALGGLLCALPIWYQLASPFNSARWHHAGGFDSLNYLGSGVLGGMFFWLLLKSRRGGAL